MDLVDRYDQAGRPSDDAMTAAVAQARIDALLATQRPLLNAVRSVRDLVRWRDEMVRGERRCDGTVYALRCLAGPPDDGGEDGGGGGDEGEWLAVHAGFAAWESLLAAAIARARDNGDLSPEADPERLATGVMAALRGGLLLARTTRDVGQLETALDMALRHVQAHAVTR